MGMILKAKKVKRYCGNTRGTTKKKNSSLPIIINNKEIELYNSVYRKYAAMCSIGSLLDEDRIKKRYNSNGLKICIQHIPKDDERVLKYGKKCGLFTEDDIKTAILFNKPYISFIKKLPLYKKEKSLLEKIKSFLLK